MRKLIVFDLDQTLVDARCRPIQRKNHRLSGATIIVQGGSLAMYTYIRPHAKTVLQICRGDPKITLALFSAGEREYVYSVIENVLLPIMDPTFYFDAIFCKDDLQENGIKNIGKVMERMHADKALLVDDLLEQCIHGAAPHENVNWFNIEPFDAESERADNDVELFELLRSPFFHCC